MPKLNIDFSKSPDAIAFPGWRLTPTGVDPVVPESYGSGEIVEIRWPQDDPLNPIHTYNIFFTEFGDPAPGYNPGQVYLKTDSDVGVGLGGHLLGLHTAPPNLPDDGLPPALTFSSAPTDISDWTTSPLASSAVPPSLWATYSAYVTKFNAAMTAARALTFSAFDIHRSAIDATILATATLEKSQPTDADPVFSVSDALLGVVDFAKLDLTVAGTPFVDSISGNADARNTIIGTLGNDTLGGGSKNDVFDYQTSGLTGATFGLRQDLSGDGQEAGGKDSALFLGSPSEYQFEIFFSPDPLSGSSDLSWKNTVIDVERRPLVGPATQVFRLKDVEHVAFQEMTNNVALTGGKIATEALELAAEVYGFRPSLDHKAEQLAWENPQSADLFYQSTVATQAAERGWHRVGALELGIKPADFGEFNHASGGALRYSFTNGFYAAKDPRFLAGYDQPEANALVLTGLVNGKKTLAISFRGTDQVADPMNFFDFSTYYALFKPLTEGIKDYLETTPIDQVLVSGHSLGAGAAQYFMNDYAGDMRFRAYTDGSPGSDVFNKQTSDPRIVNFIHTDDPVPLATAATSTAGKIAIGVVANAVALIGGPVGAAAAGAVTAGLLFGHSKFRVGSDVEMTVPIADGYSIKEHDKFEYVDSLTRLQKHAADRAADASPFDDTQLAAALRDDAVYTGPTIRVAVGRTGEFNNADVIKPTAQDAFVLGGDGNDEFRVAKMSEAGAAPSFGAIRHIDGGEGVDRLVLFNTPRVHLLINPVADSTAVDVRVGLVGTRDVGRLYRMESIILPDSEDQTIVLIPGATIPVQEAGPGDATLMVDPNFHHTDAGDGARNVIGSTRGDLILYGAGAKNIDGFLGADIILPKGGLLAGGPAAAGETTDPIVMNGNDGDDFLRGGAGDDTLNGAHDNDILIGGPGADTLDGGEDPGDMDIASATLAKSQVYIDLLDQAGGAAFMNDGAGWDRYANIEGAYGGSAADFLSGDAGANVLRGNDGGDAILGRGGDDAIEGGDGADLLMGGASYDPAETGTGNDTLEGDAGRDLIFGGDGSDIVSGGDDADFILAGAGDDAADGGAGDDFLFAGSDYVFNQAGAGNDALSGGEGIDELVGGAGVDLLHGDNGDDIVYGGSGADQIFGDGGNDSLFGDGGDDLISGGDGFDYMRGGAGADVFFFNVGDSYDVAFDFSIAEGDRLRLGADFGIASFADFKSRIAGFAFDGVDYSYLTTTTMVGGVARFDQIVIGGLRPDQWTAAMLEIV